MRLRLSLRADKGVSMVPSVRIGGKRSGSHFRADAVLVPVQSGCMCGAVGPGRKAVKVVLASERVWVWSVGVGVGVDYG